MLREVAAEGHDLPSLLFKFLDDLLSCKIFEDFDPVLVKVKDITEELHGKLGFLFNTFVVIGVLSKILENVSDSIELANDVVLIDEIQRLNRVTCDSL